MIQFRIAANEPPVNIRIRKLAKEEERIGEKLVPRLAPKIRRREVRTPMYELHVRPTLTSYINI
jgi:hypothetical protein